MSANPNNTGSDARPNRGASGGSGQHNNKKKETFKGNVKGMGDAVLQFPDKRNKGTAAQ